MPAKVDSHKKDWSGNLPDSWSEIVKSTGLARLFKKIEDKGKNEKKKSSEKTRSALISS